MAIRGKVIRNSKVGQEIRFILTATDTNGSLLEMEATYHRHSKEPPAHYHPNQEEFFEVIEGELTVRIDGQLKTLKQGELLHVPKYKVHSMWNNSDQKTVVNWKTQPALNTEYMLETFTGLANDDKTNEEGVPGILQIAVLFRKYQSEFRLARPGFGLQKVVFGVLALIAIALGYRAVHEQYLD